MQSAGHVAGVPEVAQPHEPVLRVGAAKDRDVTQLVIHLSTALGHVEALVLFCALGVAVADTFALANEVQLVFLAAPFTGSDKDTLLLLVFVFKVRDSDFDHDHFVVPNAIFEVHRRPH